MRTTTEFSVELTAQELLDQPDAAGLIEIHDICHFGAVESASIPSQAAVPIEDDAFEIELTAEEMDALLEASY